MIAFARRSFAGRLSGVVLCMTWAATAGWAGPPNLVILLADDLGYGDVGFNGGTAVPTPRLDRLAQQAVRCASGYVSAPYCSPTRAGLLTGRYQQRFGHEFNPALLSQGGTGQGLPVGEKTLADRLSAAGYAVGLVGKWHQGEEPPFHPLQRGFTEFFGFLTGAHPYFVSQDNHYGPVYRGREPAEFSGYLTDVLADEACGFIDRHRDRPFALYLAFNAVHTPLDARPEDLAAIEGVSDPTRKAYLALTAALDRAVGKVLDKLQSAGLDESTLVVFLSDNGGPIAKFAPNGANNGPLRGAKGDTWEGGIRVPFLVRWTGKLPAGKVYDRPVISLDVLPTILSAAGIAVNDSDRLDGVDFVPYLAGEKAGDPHAALYWRFGNQMAIRKGDWKLVQASLDLAKPYGPTPAEPMLVNLATDLGERVDLSAQEPAKSAELRREWDLWNGTLMAPSWPATVSGKKVNLKGDGK